jgi:5'-nucleotidase
MRKMLSAALLVAATSPVFALNIVLTNDDGFETANIQSLYTALVDAGHEVIISAPYSGQSGTGGQVAFLKPIPPTTKASAGGLLPAGSPGVGPTGIAANQYYVDGSPTASVLYGIDVKALQIWGKKPDLVISGPNEGNNLGVVTPHSGTIGAAVTALNKGIPAIAVSAEGKSADSAAVVAKLVVKLVGAIETRKGISLPEGVGLNVNTPVIDPATQTADDFSFSLTRIGTSANFGLQFFARLGDSPIAVNSGIPSSGLALPGVSVAIPPSDAGYPVDSSKRSETNVLKPLVVTVSPIQGTFAASEQLDGRVRGSLNRLIQNGHHSR